MITFHFAVVETLNSISLHVNNFGAPLSGVGVFDTATITFSNDGINFGAPAVYTTSSAERADITARFIAINLGQVSAQHVRVHLTRTTNWLFLSEVQFDSAAESVPEPSTVLLGAAELIDRGVSYEGTRLRRQFLRSYTV